MSDLAFSRKYRPRTMDDYMGDAIKNTVKARFSDKKHYPHVILLQGSRGTGKTSMARLIAKEFQCVDKSDGEFACGKCWACEEIENNLIGGGEPTNGVVELNIATDGGKKDIEDMLSDALIPPMPPIKYKIIILDECHMATPQAQNALLKIVEEPPEHLVFIFCTTDPEKMITPLKSRCQLTLEVKRPTVDELAEHLLKVCKKENVSTSIEALKIIAKKAERIPREALSLLETAAVESHGRITVDSIRNLTGEIATDYYMNFYRAANSDTNVIENLLKFVKVLKDNDVSCKDFINGLIRFTLDCMYIKYGIGLDDYPLEFAKVAKQLFKIYTTDELDAILQIIEHAIKIMNSDDNRTELIVINTGVNIGRADKLSMCITNSDREAVFENNRSGEVVRKKKLGEIDAQSNKRLPDEDVKGLDDNVMSSIFGAEITEVVGCDVQIDSDNDSKECVEDEKVNSLMSMLKQCVEE